MASERASELFQRIIVDGERAIDYLIQSRESEAYFLDFKRSSDGGAGHRLSSTDRKNLTRAISGFGNSEGGVIIWGIECSDTAGRGDVAQEKQPVNDAAAFRARVEGAISGCTIPPHEGVESHAILCEGGQAGYVATLIPKSNHAPHQTIPDMRYYMRSGSAFTPVPHGVLAGMFGRRPQPNVFANYILAIPDVAGDHISVSCGISAYNDGPGVARDIFVVATLLSMPGPNCGLDFETPDPTNWSGNMAFGVRLSLISREGYRVAPETHVQPTILHIRFAPPFDNDLKIQILVGCDGGPPYRHSWENSAENIQAAFEAITTGQVADLHDAAQLILGIPPVAVGEMVD